MANEDIIKTWVQDQLKELGYSIENKNLAKESSRETFPRLAEAMIHSSKRQTKSSGSSDFAYLVKGNYTEQTYLILIETKADTSQDENIQNEQLLFDVKSTINYAANGAVWYAKSIQKETKLFPKIIAIGVSGNYKHQKISPYYVNETGGVIALPKPTGFAEFTAERVDEYYRINVEHQIPQSELNAEELKKYASKLHNDIRDYTSLKNSLKAPLVAAILLAIHSKNLVLNDLKGSPSSKNNDGMIIYRDIQAYLDDRKLQEPDFDDSKITPILQEFEFLYGLQSLYKPSEDLNGHSPLYQFTSDLFEVYNTVKIGDDADLLGDFYSEFVKYNDSDGSVLGIVLTPAHITGLMADLLQIGKQNYLLDPTTGSGAFLVAGMNRMVSQISKDDANYEQQFREVVGNHLYGVENERSIYAVAASNMILRGDGKSNMSYGSFFDYKLDVNRDANDSKTTIYGRAPKVDRILMNPPYSQGKKAPEIKFIKHSLEILDNGGKLAVIVPISVFVTGGKGISKSEFLEFKEWLLKDYIIEAVITMNPQTFYPTATQTVIAIIQKNVGVGQCSKKTKLVNFSDDGFNVIPKKGIIPNGTNIDKRKKLIDVVVNDYDAPDDFMMKIQLTKDNEWVHNAHYTNPDKPTDADFVNAIADFISFKQDMILHGRGDIFHD